MIEAATRKPRILIIDDEPAIENLLCDLLGERYDCTTADSAEAALSILAKKTFDLVLTDINLGGMSGLELIPRVHAAAPDTVVMLISGDENIDRAISAIRDGAFDYVKKPFDLRHIEAAIKRAVEHHILLVERRRYRAHLEELVERRTAQLDHLTYHDALTNLPNRALFEDRLTQSVALARRGAKSPAVLFLSLDKFKKVHDALGSDSEIQLVKEVGERLKNFIGEAATIARFERNEFAVLLAQIDGTQKILEVVNKIKDALKSPFTINGQEIFITASVGISLYPDDGANAQALLKNAGAALYRAKQEGRNNYQFYTADLNAEAVRRMTLEADLRRALQREEFEVFYQPKIKIGTGEIAGTEALVRWRRSEASIVPPSEFIPLAEETGLIVALGEWVLRRACAQSKTWQDEGFCGLPVSVNLSPRQFQQPNLLEEISEIISDTRVDPTCLELELTESSLIENAELASRTLTCLKEKGIKISIDDFGTGCSSLIYLKQLPLDILKIDRSFVREVIGDRTDAAIVRAIVTLARNLNLKIVAEGVEAEDQLNFLRGLGCDEWQGFLYSKPVAAEHFRRLLIKNNQK